jgi:glutathione synthase/RimK-type ligase-like ATP-grasp enzyme
MPHRLAIATCRSWPGLLDDDAPLVAALRERGVTVEGVVWDAPHDWTPYDAVLLRSVWDYFERPAAFDAWLAGLERAGVTCWNPPSLVRWNADKHYLLEIQERGVPVPPLLVVEPGTPVAEALDRVRATGWDDLVLKPAISGGAWRTGRASRHALDAAAPLVEEILRESALLAQPFLPEILEHGELSFVFLEGAFSHAVRKRAKPGDYRVQWTHGGHHEGLPADPALVEQARRALHAAPEPGLYARVDGIVRDGRLLLMELEQIEPYLFFAQGPGAAVRLADAILVRLRSR